MGFDYESIPLYRQVMSHGITFIFVIIDGLILNRAPIRLKQLLMVIFVPIFYIIWTIIHSFTDIGNPWRTDEDPDTDDDALYGVLNWNQRPTQTAINSCVVILFVSPLVFHIFWFLSLVVKPRYYDVEER